MTPGTGIFTDWLGTDGAAYVSKTSMPIEEFVEAAKGSGTVFSIAHPLVNYVDEINPTSIETTMPRVLASLRERGFAGVEALLRRHEHRDPGPDGQAHEGRRDDPDGRFGLSRHYKTDVQLGFGRTGDLRVPDEVLDELKAAR